MAASEVRTLLARNGMLEYAPLLIEKGGLTDATELAQATDDDLAALGVVKVFHRKRLIAIGQAAVRAAASGATGVPNPIVTPSVGCGRHSRTSSVDSEFAAPSLNSRTTDPSSLLRDEKGGGRPAGSLIIPSSPPASRTAGGAAVVPLGHRHVGGDHLVVHVLSARGLSDYPLTERDYYVKISLCDVIDGQMYPVSGSTQRTTYARGPMPLWEAADFRVPCTFKGTQSLAFELKERHLLRDNKHIGYMVFPLTYFHSFDNDTVVENWFTMQLTASITNSEKDTSSATADIRLRLSVPGGCPRSTGNAFHVKSVLMNGRTLRLNVFDAQLLSLKARDAEVDRDDVASPRSGGSSVIIPAEDNVPDTYITVTLHKGQIQFTGSPAPRLAGAAADATPKGEVLKKVRSDVKHSLAPVFDSTFEFEDEAGQCKYITVKLKRLVAGPFGIKTRLLIGLLHLPVQFFLAQREAFEIDQVFPLVDPDAPPLLPGQPATDNAPAQLHMRLQVMPRGGGAPASSSHPPAPGGGGGGGREQAAARATRFVDPSGAADGRRLREADIDGSTPPPPLPKRSSDAAEKPSRAAVSRHPLGLVDSSAAFPTPTAPADDDAARPLRRMSTDDHFLDSTVHSQPPADDVPAENATAATAKAARAAALNDEDSDTTTTDDSRRVLSSDSSDDEGGDASAAHPRREATHVRPTPMARLHAANAVPPTQRGTGGSKSLREGGSVTASDVSPSTDEEDRRRRDI